MGIEIERKFLLAQDFNFDEHLLRCTIAIEQGYLFADQMQSIRVRTSKQNYKGMRFLKGYITIKKSYDHEGIGVAEYEYEIPYQDAQEMLSTCTKTLSKIRKVIHMDDLHDLEVDVFKNQLQGLIIAEVEFDSEDIAREYKIPSFVLKELTHDSRFKNVQLIQLDSEQATDLINAVYSDCKHPV